MAVQLQAFSTIKHCLRFCCYLLQAMKVVNMVKLKEEFDYESLCRKLDNQVDFLTAEIERLQRLREHEKEETEKKLKDCQNSFAESEKSLNASYELSEEKNSRLHLELENALDELKFHKDHNDLMQNEVARLEISLKQSKQNHLENSTYQTLLADTTQMYEKKIARLIEQLQDERALSENAQEQLFVVNKILNDHQKTSQIQEKEIEDLKMKLRDMCDLRDKTVNDFRYLRTKNEELIAEKIQCQIEVDELKQKLQDMYQLHKSTEDELTLLRTEHDDLFSLKHHEKDDFDMLRTKLQESCELHEKTVHELQIQKLGNKDLLSEKGKQNEEFRTMRQKLSDEVRQRKYLEEECLKLKKIVSDSGRDFEDKKSYLHNDISKAPPEIGSPTSLQKVCQSRETISGQRATIAKIFEEVGLEKILSMLSSDNVEVQIHAVKVIANLAAEDTNQMKIVGEGGLDSLLKLLGSSQNSTIHRVASGAIANLAMTDMNQVLIMSKGGAQLLANIASKIDDPQTLRMVAGAFANLCGNQKLHVMLKKDNGIKALMRMVQSGNIDVIAQVARGMANFAKCESRGTIHGHRKGRSLLMDDGVLAWLIENSAINSSSTRRHIELALCHLAQNRDNAQDFITSGAVKELVRILHESSREDIRNLARKTLNLNPIFQAEINNVQ